MADKYTEKSTHYGLKRNGLIWNCDFQASLDVKGKWVGSESFHCNLKDVTKVLPALNAECQMEGFSFLVMTGIDIQNIEGDLCEVKCSYGGFQTGGDFTFNDDDPNTYDNYVYDLQIQPSDEPIETFYKFHKDDPIPKEEWIIIKNYISGLYSPKPLSVYDFILSGDEATSPTSMGSVTSEMGKKLVDYLTKKQTSYRSCTQIWRVSYTTLKRPSASKLNAVGTTKKPPGAPSVASGRDWLFNGLSMQQNDKVFTITEEYALSDLGGNDAFLYEN
jgi:hypothetical protein